MTAFREIENSVSDYYSEKLRQHGPVPRGVDWNSEASQQLRFTQLMKIGEPSERFSVNEIGCGYGALVSWMGNSTKVSEYHGVDLSIEMVAAAQRLHSSRSWASFAQGALPDRPRDYCVASGIFNVRLATSDDVWFPYIISVLDTMNEYGLRGFAFNVLTKYSDADKMRDYLYYADPALLFDHCKRNYSRNVALLHDYGLYEFTILVRKEIA